MYITENLKSYLVKSENFTPFEAFSGITARGFFSAQLVGDCDNEDEFICHHAMLGDCGNETSSD